MQMPHASLPWDCVTVGNGELVDLEHKQQFSSEIIYEEKVMN